MNAYELTKELNKFMTEDEYTDLDKAIFMASNMLRQQADRIAHLEMLLANRNEIIDKLDLTTPQTKPLSDEEIQKVINQIDWNTSNVLIRFARAIEERHGIK